jgi:cytochrome c5
MFRISAKTAVAALLLTALSLPNCYYDSEEELYGTANCDTTAVKYSTTVNSILENNCYGCHKGTVDIPFGTYDELKVFADAGTLLNRMRDASNPMPPTGVLDACTINKIDAWVKAGALNN